MKPDFKPGDVIWIELENEPQQATITGLLVDAGGWCYEYKFPWYGCRCYSGGKNVYATKEECEKAIAEMK